MAALPPHVYIDTAHEAHAYHAGMHPECPERVHSILTALLARDAGTYVLHVSAPDTVGHGDKEDVMPERWECDNCGHDVWGEATCCLCGSLHPSSWCIGNGDTYVTAATPRILRRVRNVLTEAVDAMCSGGVRCAFVACRPPGHHADGVEGAVPAGFCHQNNAYFALQQFQARGWRRVCILDIDAHAGDGTEACIRRRVAAGDTDVTFVSLHAFGEGVFPGRGRGAACHTRHILNLPLPRGTDSYTYLATFRAHALPFLVAARADAIIVSCGFDGHVDDPMELLRLSTGTFGMLAQDLAALCTPMFFVLEGGYNTVTLPRCVEAVLAPFCVATT